MRHQSRTKVMWGGREVNHPLARPVLLIVLPPWIILSGLVGAFIRLAAVPVAFLLQPLFRLARREGPVRGTPENLHIGFDRDAFRRQK